MRTWWVQPTLDAIMPAEMKRSGCRCPVCGASQNWTAECRRCGADLNLMRVFAEAADDARRRCLIAVADGQNQKALLLARRLVRLRPDEAAERLLAVCYMLVGEYPSAVSLAKRDLARE